MARRRVEMQTPQPYLPDREGIESLEGILIDGLDHGELHRARVRAANAERQQRERRRGEAGSSPTLVPWAEEYAGLLEQARAEGQEERAARDLGRFPRRGRS